MVCSLSSPRIASSSTPRFPLYRPVDIESIYRVDILSNPTRASTASIRGRPRGPLSILSDRMSRVLLIGWDGAHWRILDPLVERGALPTLHPTIAKTQSGLLHS